MNHHRRRLVRGLAGGALAAGATRPLMAQGGAYPVRPIRIIVPYGAGSSTDLALRLIAPRMTQILGQPVVIENKVGATGVIGSDMVAKSPPDGYTLVMGTVASHATMGPLSPSLPYNILRDFSFIGRAVTSPALIAIHPGVPARDLGEFVAWAKSQPKGVDYASSGMGGSGHLATELLRMRTGANLVHVPYKDAARGVSDLVGGQVKMMIYYASLVPFIRGGQLRGIGVMSERRVGSLPEVPTTEEQGFAGLIASAWGGLFGPVGLPEAIRDRLYAALREAVMDPAVAPQFVTQGNEPAPLAPAEFRRFVEADIAKWTEVVRVAGVKME